MFLRGSTNVEFKKPTDIKLIIRRICLIILDSLLIVFSGFFALALRFEFGSVDEPFMQNLAECMPIFIILTLIIFWGVRIYHSLWEYISAKEVKNIMLASCASAIMQVLVVTMLEKRFGECINGENEGNNREKIFWL